MYPPHCAKYTCTIESTSLRCKNISPFHPRPNGTKIKFETKQAHVPSCRVPRSNKAHIRWSDWFDSMRTTQPFKNNHFVDLYSWAKIYMRAEQQRAIGPSWRTKEINRMRWKDYVETYSHHWAFRPNHLADVRAFLNSHIWCKQRSRFGIDCTHFFIRTMHSSHIACSVCTSHAEAPEWAPDEQKSKRNDIEKLRIFCIYLKILATWALSNLSMDQCLTSRQLADERRRTKKQDERVLFANSWKIRRVTQYALQSWDEQRFSSAKQILLIFYIYSRI